MKVVGATDVGEIDVGEIAVPRVEKVVGQVTVTGEVTVVGHEVELTTRELLCTKGPPLALYRMGATHRVKRLHFQLM
ncbi:MAG TPA: hypothetical protein VGK74_19500 [Symbiobacteriaceae bacterium]|jgi:hypothetical protein